MKKYLIIAATALVAMCACTKNELAESAIADEEINFQVATYSNQTKADDYASKYASVPFATYAWFYQTASASAQPFMVDEKVSYTAAAGQTPAKWAPSKTYYWPKTGAIDFISFSPYAIHKFVKVGEKSIAFYDKENPYEVPHVDQEDIMYADKAVGMTKDKALANNFKYNDVAKYSGGVPTLFHHALTNLNFNIKTAYDEVVVGDNDKTSWKVTVQRMTMMAYLNKGYLVLSLNDADKWVLPSTNVWTSVGEPISEEDAQKFPIEKKTIKSTAYENFVSNYIVLPQKLVKPILEIVLDIETTLPNGSKINETGVKILANLNVPANTEKGITGIQSWDINKKITYNLIISPSAGDDPTEPVAITFDPAVEDWNTDDASATIEK